jgi:tRNA modification GTPase
VRDADGVERLGVERTRSEVASADLAVWVVDSSAASDLDEERSVAGLVAGRPHVVAWSKADLGSGAATDSTLRVSAKTGAGIPALREAIARGLGASGDGPAGGEASAALVTNRRHIEALDRAREAIDAARAVAAAGEPGELVAGELRLALEALGAVTGEAAAPDLLERIFARFCVGK